MIDLAELPDLDLGPPPDDLPLDLGPVPWGERVTRTSTMAEWIGWDGAAPFLVTDLEWWSDGYVAAVRTRRAMTSAVTVPRWRVTVPVDYSGDRRVPRPRDVSGPRIKGRPMLMLLPVPRRSVRTRHRPEATGGM